MKYENTEAYALSQLEEQEREIEKLKRENHALKADIDFERNKTVAWQTAHGVLKETLDRFTEIAQPTLEFCKESGHRYVSFRLAVDEGYIEDFDFIVKECGLALSEEDQKAYDASKLPKETEDTTDGE